MYKLEAPGFVIDNAKQPKPDPLAAARYGCVFEYYVDNLHIPATPYVMKASETKMSSGRRGKIDFPQNCYLSCFLQAAVFTDSRQGVSSCAKATSPSHERADPPSFSLTKNLYFGSGSGRGQPVRDWDLSLALYKRACVCGVFFARLSENKT